MAIRQLSSGRFGVRVIDPESGRRISIGGGFDTRIQAEEAEERFLAGGRGLRSETAPFKHAFDLPGGATWGAEAGKEKRQEYNRTMGEVADVLSMLSAGEVIDSGRLERVAKYSSDLAEQEKRFINRRRARSVSLAVARDALLVRQFTEAAAVVFKDKVVPKGYAVKKSTKKASRIVNLLLSDLHFGARLDGKELPIGFDARTEVRRLAKVVAEAAEYKPHYRDDSTLHIYVNGDIIEGYLLHDVRDGDPLTDQFTGIVYALTQAIAFLAAAYPEVRVFWQSGNHGRNKLRHPGRATSSKWDSFETMAGVAARLACAVLKNVTWDIPLTPYCAVPLFESRLLLTHGDTILNVGNPGKSLNLQKIDQQMARINTSEQYGGRFDVFAVGHVHIGVSVALAAGHLMVNPPLVPANGFAESLGYVSQCGQWLWESTEGYPVGDSRLVCVGKAEDEDPALEKIIKPARFSYDP